MKTISIIGYGRFGQVLHRLLKDDFSVVLYDRKGITATNLGANTRVAKDLQEVFESDVIFYAVPIPAFEQTILAHKKYFKPEHLLVDVLSVKMHPESVFKKHLKGLKTRALLTHPMFGPDSSAGGFEGLPLIMDRCTATPAEYLFWKKYFERKKLRAIEMTAREHDKLAANSQGLTHFIGRLLERLNIKEGRIDSLGTKKLLEVEEQTCNDTWELFAGLQHYNPYTKQMRLKLGTAYDALYNKLLPKSVKAGVVTYGIQGGKGSFNEEAMLAYIKKHDIQKLGPTQPCLILPYQGEHSPSPACAEASAGRSARRGVRKSLKYEIKYLFTSERVLRSLHEGDIDFGLFATHNAQGGIVHESVHAMARYKFKIVDEQEILIRHFLMKRPDVKTEELTRVIGHSQNFKQCKDNLAQRHPQLKQETGKGDLVDTAKAASFVASGKLPKTTAILGPKALASLYGFDIVDADLQDLGERNITNFLLVGR
ncbi:MAG: Arogenate dehydrogenase 2 [Parcubacteria group bacterium GW2011_GWA2_49_9]|nr:MAG: Arogenate dehydrogenase 2 [Parcubacteria group bacterium GW2011_GWA2_49_9]